MLDEDSLTSPLRDSATRVPASCATFLSAEERGASWLGLGLGLGLASLQTSVVRLG